MVSPAGFEPATPGLGILCSILLSYGDTGSGIKAWGLGGPEAIAQKSEMRRGLQRRIAYRPARWKDSAASKNALDLMRSDVSEGQLPLDDTAPAPFPVPEPGQPAPATRTAEAYARLRQDILSNALSPGQRITIQFLQKRYGIGPTPLREALARLAADGFVIGEDNRGFRVPPMSLARLRDITDQRKLIEAQGLKLSIAHGGKTFDAALRGSYAKLAKLDEARGRGEADAYVAWENQHRLFHAALIAGCGSEWLIRFQGILFDQADRYRRLYSEGRQNNPEIQKDHARILEATLEKDAEMAALLLERHIERVYATAKLSGRLPED